MTTIITLVILVLVIFAITGKEGNSYGCFKGCQIIISLVVLSCIGLYIIAGFEEKIVSYTVTNVNVQRIEVEDSIQNGKVLYLVCCQCKTNKGHKWEAPRFFAYKGIHTTSGNTEHIEDIYIQDSYKNKINVGTGELNILHLKSGIDRYGQYICIESGNIRDIHQIKEALKSKHLDGNDNYYLFYVNEGTPLPAYLTLHFKERDIRVKINNTPVKYKTN